jgi:hypothetical protein
MTEHYALVMGEQGEAPELVGPFEDRAEMQEWGANNLSFETWWPINADDATQPTVFAGA